MIKNASDQTVVHKCGGYKGYVLAAARNSWGDRAVVNWSEPRGVTHAFVVRGNWVAECPYCRSVLFIESGVMFFCPDCLMMGNEGHPMFVAFPDGKDKARIEYLLGRRPAPVNRNWLLRETIEMLYFENLMHGVAV